MNKKEVMQQLIDDVEALPFRDQQRLDALIRKADMLARNIFEKPSYEKYSADLKAISFHPRAISLSQSNEPLYNAAWKDGVGRLKNLFLTMLDELEMFGECGDKQEETVPQSQSMVPQEHLFDALNFHEEIVQVSKHLFMSEHYAPAVFEAFKAVNNAVKEKSRILDDDGQSLMAFVFKKDDPILKINAMRNQSDRDEQDGFKLLYMGAMTGIRNPKAHENIILNDPYRALHYLAFASLLRTRVDEAKRSRSASASATDRRLFFSALRQNTDQATCDKVEQLFAFAESNPLGEVEFGRNSFKFKVITRNGGSTVFVASSRGFIDMISRLWERFPDLRKNHVATLCGHFPFIKKSKLMNNAYYEVEMSRFGPQDIDMLVSDYERIARELAAASDGQS